MTTSRVQRRAWLGGSAADLVLRLLVAAGLGVVAYVHADLAPGYAGVRATLSEGELFWATAVAASVAALVALVVGRATGFGLALLVAASALGAIVLYRYVDVGPLGPLPNMYEPIWFAEKTVAAVAAAATTVLAARGLLRTLRVQGRRGATDYSTEVSHDTL
jgi:hypothetical protein